MASISMEIVCVCLHKLFEYSNLSQQVLPDSSEIYATQNSNPGNPGITKEVYSSANLGVIAMWALSYSKIQQKRSNCRLGIRTENY